MPPERSEQLVYELKAWYRSHSVRQKDLAGSLGMFAQQLAEVLSMRNRPTGEQALRILEFLNAENMKPQLVDPPQPRATVSNPGQPKTLQQAKEMLETLRLENAQLKAGAVTSPAKTASPAAAPTAKPKLAGADSPTYPPAPIKTPGSDQPNKNEMKVGVPAPKTMLLDPSLDTPFKITEHLKLTPLSDLVLLLNNPAHSAPQRALIYQAIKEVRNLEGN